MVRYHQHPAALLWPAARRVTLPLLPRGFNYPCKWLSEPVSSVSLLSMLATPSSFRSGSPVTAGILAQQVQVEFGEQIYKDSLNATYKVNFGPQFQSGKRKRGGQRVIGEQNIPCLHAFISSHEKGKRKQGRRGCELV